MTRVLVTGATGGLGLALVREFRGAGWQVRATGRSLQPANRLAELGAQFVQGDLTRPGIVEELCTGMDLVVHAAALSASWGDKAAFDAINVGATRALLDAAQRAGCGRFVFVSSPSIYAAMHDRFGLTEMDTPTTPPLNHYARSKLKAERLVLSASRRGFQTCAVRPRALVGPDDRVLLPRLVVLARRGWIPLPRHGRALIELTDTRDAATAILRAADCIDAIAGEAVNISSGKPVTVASLTRALTAELGIRPRLIPLPMWMAHLLAAAGARRAGDREPVLTPYTLATLAFSQTFDLTKARQKLGYEARHDALATLLQSARALA